MYIQDSSISSPQEVWKSQSLIGPMLLPVDTCGVAQVRMKSLTNRNSFALV
jgi:hypothetical protein